MAHVDLHIKTIGRQKHTLVCVAMKLFVRHINSLHKQNALLIQTKCANGQIPTGLFTAGTATVTLTSTLGGRQTACPGEFVTYTCTVLRTSAAGWHVPPDIMELNYFPSSTIGQRVIGDFQLTLTNKDVDPNNAALADLTITLRVTATAGRNGTVVQCRGDEPGERMSLVLNIASEQCVQLMVIIMYLEIRAKKHILCRHVMIMLLLFCSFLFQACS